MSKENKTIYDVAVIGGGPAGMMAAGRAAELGARVILIEKNKELGKKLLITGGGRCNLTNAEMDTRKFLGKLKESAKFLFSAFAEFGVKETLDFFHNRGLETKVEAEKRVFPKSDSAQSVWNVLREYMMAGGVTVALDSPATGFAKREDKITSIGLKNKKEIFAKSFILATGGKSYPETGSTGDGFIWLKELGHKVTESGAALVPVAIGDIWVRQLQGVSLPRVKITILQNNIKQESNKGKILFTHFGLSGPAILNISSQIGELLGYGDVVISLDILPELDHGALNEKLQEIFKENSNKKFKNSLAGLLPAAIAGAVVVKSGINQDKFCHSITRVERLKLIKFLKDLRMKAAGLLGAKKAIVTSGGVELAEVDFKTMRSRLYQNLYLVGDILNIDRPSGGYSLQLCWTTGYVAGRNAAE
ncbi:NAD(P)/FAD-dependent oxidoreductase [Candidatus Uhrbacteria bacterium]|nr:NAD(P)/FAD-dependent oxidoreductase [Candidatus Uhrbacteria bacterium]